MLTLAVNCCVSLIIGAFLGSQLAARGIRADSTLENQQGIILSGLIAIAAIIFSLVIVDKLNLVHLLPLIIPSITLLYIGGYASQTILALGCVILGLLVFLELRGKLYPQRMFQLFAAVVIIVIPLAILIHFSVPIIDMVGEPRVIREIVVLQTTPYTCAPATIATLARFVAKHPQITEREVVALTNTDRFGTRTLAEIWAMEKLGLEPQYQYGLKLGDLVKKKLPALLHVREQEEDSGESFSHAVALLLVKPKEHLMILGNPLYGLQVKTFAQMKEYWQGEAVFVTFDREQET